MNAIKDENSSLLASLRTFSDAFGAQDAPAILKLFASSSDVSFLASEAGEFAFGQEKLRDLLAELFARNETYTWELLNVSISREGSVGWAVAQTNILVHRGKEIKVYPYRFTVVAQFDKGKWMWRHFHGSEPSE